MPDNLKRLCEGTKRINAGFDYKLHDPELLDRYAGDAYVRSMQLKGEPIAFIVDRLRLLLLRDEGGIYLDADAESTQSFSIIDHILNDPKTDFVTGMRNPHRPGVALHRGVALIDNTVMLSAKNGRVINRLCSLYRPESLVHNGHSIGVEVMRCLDHDVTLLNYKYFYSDVPSSETIALHDFQNLSSWCLRRPTLAAV